MPVVSQSIIRPMVPVGASTEACALRQPFFSPILLPVRPLLGGRGEDRAVDRRAAGATASLAAACLRMTRVCAVGVAGVALVRADDRRPARPSGGRTCRSSAR